MRFWQQHVPISKLKLKCVGFYKFSLFLLFIPASFILTYMLTLCSLYRPITEVTSRHVISRTGGQASKQIVCVRGPI